MANELFRIEADGPVLLGTECQQCHYTWFPRRFLGCERCGAHGDDLAAREFAATGRLVSFADISLGSAPTFGLALIALNQGPVLRAILTDTSHLSIDDPVEAIAIDDGEHLRFRGVAAPAG